MIENHLRLTWSPETIAAKFKLATASIYNWLNQGQLAFDLQDLPNCNCRRQHTREKRGQYLMGTSIEQRPVTINQRQEFGHWKVDTVLSSRGPACLVTFGERQSCLFWTLKTSDRTCTILKPGLCELYSAFWQHSKNY